MKKKMILSMAGMMVFGFAAGAGLMLNDQAYLSIKGVISGGGTNNFVTGNPGGIQQMDIQGMDLETALIAVQSQRANLLDSQLKSQLESINNRNKLISDLNGLITASHEALANSVQGGFAYKSNDTVNRLYDNRVIDSKKTVFKSEEIRTIIEKLKGKVDSLNSSQQMDMLRMQSLTNKHNEAFDVMTNFIKKMQDSRSSIIGNMRN